MVERRERYMKHSASEVTTLSEIAAKLKDTPMVRSNISSGLTSLSSWTWKDCGSAFGERLEEEKAK